MIEQKWLFNTDNFAFVAQEMLKNLKEVQANGGMVVELPNSNGKKVWVPIQMITYIETDLVRSTAPMPVEDPENPGHFLDGEGNKVLKQ